MHGENGNVIQLPVIRESTENYERLEEAVKTAFKRFIYAPLAKEFEVKTSSLKNDSSEYGELADAIRSGRLTFSRGTFSGRLNSRLSRELRALGARFDRKQGCYKVALPSLPTPLRNLISASETKYAEKIATIDKKLAQILPEEIAGSLKLESIFDRTLWKIEGDFQRSVKGITLAPKLTKEQAARISKEWSENMQLWVEDFTKREILELRAQMQKTVFAGNRYGSAVKTIKDSYGVSANKAKFLARQETGLLVAKYKQVRYQEAGVNWYKWKCVSGSKDHPVRPSHKILDGRIFRWDNPPMTTAPGEPVRHCNPKQDYNCRCYAIPLVGYQEKNVGKDKARKL